jgi:RNA 2',3'-cyclic 3'-phosphodiesterase
VRLFVALEVPARVRGEVADALASVQASARGVRWTDPSRWHLTLAFLGEVEPRRVDGLVARLGRMAARHDPPVLQVAGAGRFDGRVLWAGVHEVPPAAGRLAPLAASVAAAARHSGIDVEDRRYRAHLTLARAAAPTDLRQLVTSLGALLSGEWTPPDVLLVQSRLGPAPEHSVVAALPLRSGSARPRSGRPA